MCSPHFNGKNNKWGLSAPFSLSYLYVALRELYRVDKSNAFVIGSLSHLNCTIYHQGIRIQTLVSDFIMALNVDMFFYFSRCICELYTQYDHK